MSKIIGLGVVALVASAASAQLYDNGAADYANGNEMCQWLQTEDFMLGAGGVAGGATFGLLDFSGGTLSSWDGSLQWFIFDSSGGVPDNVIASGNAQNLVINYLGEGFFSEYHASFDFGQAVALAGGTQYHLGLHMASDYDSRDDIYWASTAFNTTNTGIESDQGTMDNWFNNGVEHAFTIEAIPAPGALALLGLGGLVGTRRRR